MKIFDIEIKEGQYYIVQFIEDANSGANECLCTANDLKGLLKGEPIEFINGKDNLSEIFDGSENKKSYIHFNDVVRVREFHFSEIFGEEE